MTQQVRQSVFETNSSSTHSIHISNKECVLDTLRVDDDGVCRIYPGEFGWEVQDYYGAECKASYCMTFLFQDNRRYDKDYNSRVEFDSDGQQLLDMLTEVIQEVTRATKVEYVGSNDKYYQHGYIDHQSHGVCRSAFKNKKTLKNFIFNPNSVLHTDNDNHY